MRTIWRCYRDHGRVVWGSWVYLLKWWYVMMRFPQPHILIFGISWPYICSSQDLPPTYIIKSRISRPSKFFIREYPDHIYSQAKNSHTPLFFGGEYPGPHTIQLGIPRPSYSSVGNTQTPHIVKLGRPSPHIFSCREFLAHWNSAVRNIQTPHC